MNTQISKMAAAMVEEAQIDPDFAIRLATVAEEARGGGVHTMPVEGGRVGAVDARLRQIDRICPNCANLEWCTARLHERKMTTCWWSPSMFNPSTNLIALAALAAIDTGKVERLREALASYPEWCSRFNRFGPEFDMCDSCGNHRQTGHSKDCKIVALTGEEE